MYGPTASVVERLNNVDGTSVIGWGCPVPFFGQLLTARIATVGINPSNREFLDGRGSELFGPHLRLPTLNSLGIGAWCDANAVHLREILDACSAYFLRNPYDRWFKVLEQVLAETDSSFYGARPSACHLDLIPYATSVKWGELLSLDRKALLEASRGSLGLFLRESPVKLLVLNGQAVVDTFQELTGTALTATAMPGWVLPRTASRPVPGIAYRGHVEIVGGIELPRRVIVIGYNHNLQSSYGVTGDVLDRIRQWVGAIWKRVG